MTKSGWAVAWDVPTFADARDKIDAHRRSGLFEFLHPTLAHAYYMASTQVFDDDTHKAKVFWVVRDTTAATTTHRNSHTGW